MAKSSGATASLADARTAASLVGVSTTPPKARDRGYGALAERLMRSLVEEIAEVKGALPTANNGGLLSMKVRDEKSLDVLEQILVEARQMNAHLELITGLGRIK